MGPYGFLDPDGELANRSRDAEKKGLVGSDGELVVWRTHVSVGFYPLRKSLSPSPCDTDAPTVPELELC
ncbi:hypothetical protein KPH14_002412 [Odynerus spinipes]|uniref:Uncharacterized protein n=1 Tax=Odynerus spinipes TaxID=1348599 RepID=A0AAD9VQ44_9HYME|nr:hypothetical protein KPH14_002412 [Odynerus spinipes]